MLSILCGDVERSAKWVGERDALEGGRDTADRERERLFAVLNAEREGEERTRLLDYNEASAERATRGRAGSGD